MSSVAFGIRVWADHSPASAAIRAMSLAIAGDEIPILQPGERHATHVSIERWTKHSRRYVQCEGIEAVPWRVRRYDPRAAAARADTRLYVLPDPQHPLAWVTPTMPASPHDLALRLFAAAESHLGEPYDLCPGYLLCVWYGLTHQAPRFLDNPHARIFCSGLADAVLTGESIEPYRDRRAPYDTTPLSLEFALQQTLGWTRVQ